MKAKTAPASRLDRIQYWLAELDQYGNPTLVDGAHSNRAGVVRAMALYERLARDGFAGRPGTCFRPRAARYGIARIEIEEIPQPGREQ